MATVQVDEAQLLASKNVVDTVSAILAHPEARPLLLKAKKLTDPTAVIPEIDAAEPINREVAALRKMIEEDAATRAKEREEEANRRRLDEITGRIDRQRSELRANGWRDEGIAEVEKFALENGIGDLTIAADAWEKRNPPAAPAQPSGGGSWDFFSPPQNEDDAKFIKEMIDSRGEDEGALNREIQAALADVRGSQSAARR